MLCENPFPLLASQW